MTTRNGAPAGVPDVLAVLRLSREDYEALTRQGFVAPEYRGKPGCQSGPHYKLRWRCGGRQRVLNLGRDPERARLVREALAELQRPGRLARLAAKLLREASRRLREVKGVLEPCLAAQGLHLHGYATRRTSSPAPRVNAETKSSEGDSFTISVNIPEERGDGHEGGERDDRANSGFGKKQRDERRRPGGADKTGAAGVDPPLLGAGPRWG